ncbi:FIST signal transduction protein [Celerinatantimonas yamalensis]|uniref:FIST N-terminal domain-containing protein n=1 Tax=Celerinatantimonas yamalensis TaxID=559956 RepID=A0ABW9GDB8_9GAMM
MKIATAFSVLDDTEKACCEVIEQLTQDASCPPNFIVCYYSAKHQYLQIANKLQFAFLSIPIIACSSCQGVMTADGFHSESGAGLTLWAIWDDYGHYGTGLECIDNITDDASVYQACQSALQQALAGAGRLGELPELIWLHASPGFETQMIAALEEMVGDQVPIAGGSAADQYILGDWSLFNQTAVTTQGVAVAALFPGGEIGYSFHSGYVASRALGTVTASHHRTIEMIDHRPAAEVYLEAIDEPTSDFSYPHSILEKGAFHPIGRIAGQLDQFPIFKLAHPSAVDSNAGLELFADVQCGELLYLMEGSRQSLIHRGGRVTQLSLTDPFSHQEPIGALVIYCAGCMLAVHDDVDAVVASIRRSLGEKLPFAGAFTFGEQGHFMTGKNGHGNLMCSAVVFYQRELL